MQCIANISANPGGIGSPNSLQACVSNATVNNPNFNQQQSSAIKPSSSNPNSLMGSPNTVQCLSTKSPGDSLSSTPQGANKQPTATNQNCQVADEVGVAGLGAIENFFLPGSGFVLGETGVNSFIICCIATPIFNAIGCFFSCIFADGGIVTGKGFASGGIPANEQTNCVANSLVSSNASNNFYNRDYAKTYGGSNSPNLMTNPAQVQCTANPFAAAGGNFRPAAQNVNINNSGGNTCMLSGAAIQGAEKGVNYLLNNACSIGNSLSNTFSNIGNFFSCGASAGSAAICAAGDVGDAAQFACDASAVACVAELFSKGGQVASTGSSRQTNGGMKQNIGFVNKQIPTNSLSKGGTVQKHNHPTPPTHAAPPHRSLMMPPIDLTGPAISPAKTGAAPTQLAPMSPMAKGGMAMPAMKPHASAPFAPQQPAFSKPASRAFNSPGYAAGGLGSDPGTMQNAQFYDGGGAVQAQPAVPLMPQPGQHYDNGGFIGSNPLSNGGMPQNVDAMANNGTYGYACGGPGLGSPPPEMGAAPGGPPQPQQQTTGDPKTDQAMQNQQVAEQVVPKDGTTDDVDAKVSKGEFVMDAATVMYYGMGKMVQMQQKAHEEIAKHLAKQAIQQQSKQGDDDDSPPQDNPQNSQPPAPPQGPPPQQAQGGMGAPPMPTRMPPQAASPPNATEQRIAKTNTPHGGSPFSLMG